MAYSTDNPPYRVGGTLGGDASQWVYKSADVDGTVTGAGYITNALELGMKVGDPVTVIDTTTPLTSACYVASFTGSAATLGFQAVS